MRLERTLRALSLFPYVQGGTLPFVGEKNTELGEWPPSSATHFGVWHREEEPDPAVLTVRVKLKMQGAKPLVWGQSLVDQHPQEAVLLYPEGEVPCQAIQLFFMEGVGLPPGSQIYQGATPLREGQLWTVKTFQSPDDATSGESRTTVSYVRREEGALWVEPPGQENVQPYWGYGGLAPPGGRGEGAALVRFPLPLFFEQSFFTLFYQQGKTLVQRVFAQDFAGSDGISPVFMGPGLMAPSGGIQQQRSLFADIQEGALSLLLRKGRDPNGKNVEVPYRSFDLTPDGLDRIQVKLRPENLSTLKTTPGG